MESTMSLFPVLVFAVSNSLLAVASHTLDSDRRTFDRESSTMEQCPNTEGSRNDEYDDDGIGASSSSSISAVSSDHCQVYLFTEWTSSTGLLFSILLLYIALVTITNIVVVYKFIATWNQITVSLREQNRVCIKYAHIPITRRLTCPEALPPSRYQLPKATDHPASSCPICLIDFQDQEYIASCHGGCATLFHRDCIYAWLNYQSAEERASSPAENHTCCPCCRKELLGITTMEEATAAAGGKPAISSSGFVSDLSTLMGYYPY